MTRSLVERVASVGSADVDGAFERHAAPGRDAFAGGVGHSPSSTSADPKKAWSLRLIDTLLSRSALTRRWSSHASCTRSG